MRERMHATQLLKWAIAILLYRSRALVHGIRGILDGRAVASFEECYPDSDNHPRFSMGWLKAE